MFHWLRTMRSEHYSLQAFPADVKPREIYNLFREFPGYESSHLLALSANTQGFGHQLPCWSPTSLTFQHWAGGSPHTWSYDFAETSVFGKQSPGRGQCNPLCKEAPLLLKLRGYSVEFLRELSCAPGFSPPTHLSLFRVQPFACTIFLDQQSAVAAMHALNGLVFES